MCAEEKSNYLDEFCIQGRYIKDKLLLLKENKNLCENIAHIILENYHLFTVKILKQFSECIDFSLSIYLYKICNKI